MISIDRYHVPVVARHGDGWGVHCLACSAKADDYVYECEQRGPRRPEDPVWAEWPPRILVEPTDV